MRLPPGPRLYRCARAYTHAWTDWLALIFMTSRVRVRWRYWRLTRGFCVAGVTGRPVSAGCIGFHGRSLGLIVVGAVPIRVASRA
jgi:hypothetical protein